MKKTLKNVKTIDLKWFGWTSGYSNRSKVKRDFFWNCKPSEK
ncbi:MAG: hypothetical protein ACX93O_15065 [Flagellimonas sp.]